MIVGTVATAPTGTAVGCTVVPHWLQNFACEGSDVPQLTQASVNALPHSRQNLAPGRFSIPQFEQCMRHFLGG
jgi:hypothetical protein